MKSAGVWIFLLALAALGAGGCALTDQFGSGARKKHLLSEAAQALARQDMPAAVAALEKARDIDGRDPDVLIRLGQAYLANGKEDQAFLPFKEASALDGGAGALLPLGRLLRRRKAYAEAEPVLKRALATEKERGPVLVELGIAYWLLDRVDDAKDTLEKAIAEVPDSFVAQFHLGEVYRRKEDYARARDRLNAALRLEPESPFAAFALAEVLFATGEVGPAGELYRKVVAANRPFPRLGRVYFQLAQIAYRRREARNALGLLELAARSGYDADLIAVWEMRVALTIRDHERAAKAFEKVKGKVAAHPQVAYLQGRLEIVRGRYAEAVAALEAAAKLPLDPAEVQAALGTALLAQLDRIPVPDEKLVDAAVAAYARALRARARSIEALLGMARLHALYRVDLQLAATHLKTALAAQKEDPEIQSLLAPVLARLGLLEPALEQLAALAEAPRDPRRDFLRGAILLALNRAREAEESVVRGLGTDSRDLDGRLVLTAIYSRTGRLDPARELLARLLDPAADSELDSDAELHDLAIAAVLGPARPPDPFRAPTARLERRLAQVQAELPKVPPARALELLRSLVGEFCMMELRHQLPREDRERLRAQVATLLATRSGR